MLKTEKQKNCQEKFPIGDFLHKKVKRAKEGEIGRGRKKTAAKLSGVYK